MYSRNLMSEISDLAMRARENRLSDAQAARLNELLEASDDACRALLFSGMVDAELMARAHEEAAQDRVLDAIEADSDPSDFAPVLTVPRQLGRGWVRWLVRGMATC